MKKDRFKGYDADVRRLVLEYEELQQQNRQRYFDPDEMETIIDFYLDTIDNSAQKNTLPADTRRLERSITYAEHFFPTAPGIRLRRAHLYAIQGRYDQALQLLQELERNDPDNSDVQYALGSLYSAIDQPRKAIGHYQRATRDGYQLGTIYGNMGDEYYRMGRLEDSIRYYKKAVARNADEERSLLNLEATYDELGLNDEALAFYQRFLRQTPYSRVGWFCQGRILMALADRQGGNAERYRQAIEAFRLTLSIDSGYFDAYILIAECQQALGDGNAAIATLRESMDYASDTANVLFSIATIYMGQRNYTTAAIYLKQAAERDPYFSEAWLKLAECNHAMGYIDEADELYRMALGMNEQNDEFWLLYADFLIDNNQFEEATDLLERGIATADYPHAFSQRLILCHYRTGQRYKLFNTLLECLQSGMQADEMLAYCPELQSDPDVVDLIAHH